MSTQDPDAPKRRSSAANRRRNRRSTAVSSEESTATATAVKPQESTTQAPPASAGAKAAAAREEKAKHLRRQEERQAAKSQKSEKSGTKKLVNTERFGGVQRFYQSTASEIKKVNWPDRETTRNLTIVVIALSVVMGVLLGSIDYVLFQIFEALP